PRRAPRPRRAGQPGAGIPGTGERPLRRGAAGCRARFRPALAHRHPPHRHRHRGQRHSARRPAAAAAAARQPRPRRPGPGHRAPRRQAAAAVGEPALAAGFAERGPAWHRARVTARRGGCAARIRLEDPMPRGHTVRALLLAPGLLFAAALSAQAPATSPPTVHVPVAGETAGRANGERHTLNLKAADIGVLVQTVSEITGKSFIVDPRVEGRVTVVSSKPMDADEVYAVFQSVLRVHGFAAVPAGGVVKIVPEAFAAQDGGIGPTGSGGPDALVSRIIEVRHVSAQELAQWLRPLLPQQGHLAA